MIVNKTNHTLYDIKISDEELLDYYFNLSLGLCISPFREENKPSFSIYLSNGRVKYKDFATGEFGGIYDMIMQKYNLSLKEMIEKILSDFKNHKPKQYQYHSNKKGKVCTHIADTDEGNVNIKVRICKWDDKRISYLASYGIDYRFASKYRIVPIDYYFINNNPIKADDIAFAYIEFYNESPMFKIYQPLSITRKWRNNFKQGTMSLIDFIDKDEQLIIVTSSVKDALCLMNNSSLKAISPQGEGFDVDFNMLKGRFPNASFYILFDNDKAGIRYAEKLSCKYQVPMILLPSDGNKDISDVYRYEGKEKFEQIVASIKCLISSQVLKLSFQELKC